MFSSTVSSPVLYLCTIVFLSPLAFACAIVFIDPYYTLQRTALLILSIAFTAQLQYSIPVFTGNSTYDGGIMALFWMFHLRAFDLLLWKAVYLNSATVENLKRSAIPSIYSRIFTAWCLLFNVRNINTPWTIKGVPAFSGVDPEYVPSKNEFVKRRIAHILITYLVLDALFAFAPPPDPDFDVPESKEPIFSRIGDITLEEIVTRPFTVIVPAFCIYSIFNISYNIASIIAVLFCGGEPQDWPPLFGSFLEAYTLRRFWGYV